MRLSDTEILRAAQWVMKRSPKEASEDFDLVMRIVIDRMDDVINDTEKDRT